MEYTELIDKLAIPLCRLVLFMSLGLLVAGLLESMHWIRFIARLASPLARLGHQREVAGASFAMAFIAPASSNAMLAQAHAKGELSRRELVLANLLNSTPTFLVHLPTMFSVAAAFLGSGAVVYVGLSFAAAALRTGCTLIVGRCLLPLPPACHARGLLQQGKDDRRAVISKTLTRLRKRIGKMLKFTVPIYCIFFGLQQAGWFMLAEQWLAEQADWFSFLNPQAMSIITLYLLAESGAAMSAAASLGAGGALADHDIIMALLVGNILATPMRALRHQFPSYAGFYAPPLALFLVVFNQLCRAASLGLIAFFYYCSLA